MNKKDTQIVETVSGTWLRFPNSFKKLHCLVDLEGQLSLNINLKSGIMHVHKKDSNDVYQYIGDLLISSIGNQFHCSVLPVQTIESLELSHQRSDAS